MDPRIGKSNDGTHYAFIYGYEKPEVRGTLSEVQAALKLEDMRGKKVTAKWVKFELMAARKAAVKEAKRDGWKVIQHRACSFVGTRGDHRTKNFDESILVFGSYPPAKLLKEVIELAKADGCDSLSLEGGLDGADSVRDMCDGMYEPWIIEFDVEIPLT